MRCPVDRHALSGQNIGAVSIATCGECAGVWLTRKALLAPSVEPSALPAETRRPRSLERRGRRIRVCPECTQPLESQRIEGVEIDRCTHCKGVWLDAGEYDAVRKRIEIQPRITAKPGGKTGFDVVGPGFEVLFEALVTMLLDGLL